MLTLPRVKSEILVQGSLVERLNLPCSLKVLHHPRLLQFEFDLQAQLGFCQAAWVTLPSSY